MAARHSKAQTAGRKYHVYILIDPQTQDVRYVGVTSNLYRRRLEHLRHARYGINTDCAKWVRQLMSFGLEPIWCEIAVVDYDQRESAEIYWIAHYRSLGAPLTNHTIGGNGVVGLSKEIRERGAKKLRGRKLSEETKRKIGEASLGRNHSEETIAAIRAKHVGKKLSAEHKAKLSAAKTGKKMPPRTESHSAKIAEGLRRAWARRRSE